MSTKLAETLNVVSTRAREIPPFLAMDVLDRTRVMEKEGRQIVHMELGEPDWPTAPHVVEAAYKAIKDGYTTYTPTQGLQELREAISEYYVERYGLQINPDRIVVTMGTSPALFLVFGVLLEAGDEVILSDPHYACYPNTVSFMGGKPVFFDLKEDEGFVYSGGRVKEKISPRTRALMVNSPSNPTGIVLDRANLAQIADGFPGFIISDEIYHRVVYGEKAHSILEFTDRAFVLNGFSKLYAMTGWRLGYIIAPMDFIRSLHKIHQNFFLSANAFVQKAGVAALKGPQDSSAQMVRVYNQRRQFLIRELRKLGFGITVEPTGAFYVLANARRYGADSVALANRILTQAGVAVTPGIDFGKNAEGYLRFSYATSLNEIKKAIHRIGEWLNK